LRSALILALGIATIFLVNSEVVPAAGNKSVQAQIDKLLSGVTAPGDPGLAILVKRGSDTYFEKGYGVREVGKPGAIDPSTNFRLASVTKQFTAMAIMLLVHDGKLRYEDRLTDIWPDFPEYGKQITVRQMLTHTSGLRDYETLMDVEEKARGPRWSAEHQIQDAEVLALLKAQTSGEFAAGTKWEYSNSGYVTLGLIVAKVSGMTYGDYLQRRLFGALRMNHTLVHVKGKNEVANRALGYTKEGAVFRATDQSPTSATLGDGGIYSNVQDLEKWNDALAKHTLLSQKEMLPAWTSAKKDDGSDYFGSNNSSEDKQASPVAIKYGFGWFLDTYRGHARQYHDGESIGFRSTIQRFVEGPVTIIILCNRTDLSPHELAEKITDLILPEGNK
jgi:CubicO group peptidase (beta-lactamase class C family)